ncbi:MAG: hypothetical protein A3C47_02005 [Omnitrophica bacterium RIFCSPHIGHO2_02_FULL_51_18]|nr:MAG: hypothetical protein A3C47_02005 [Omnitrophica bacterium RIFCSPHIGHO2_02_FULL_51_18]
MPHLHKLSISGFIFLFAACAAPLNALEIEYAKVFDVTGSVKFAGFKSGRWQPLLRNLLLKSGTRVKTGNQSSVQIKLNRDFTGVLKLSPNSYLELKNEPPNKIYLEKGDLFVICEADTEAAPAAGSGALQVSTKDLLMEIRQGGCIISVSDRGTWLKVFQEKVEAAHVLADRTKTKTWTVHEGYQLHAKSSGAHTSLKRMQYENYDAWQVWIRGWYDHKDKIAAEKMRKELSA